MAEWRTALLLVSLILMTIATLALPSAAAELPPAQVVLPSDILERIPLSGRDYIQGPQFGRMERVAVEGQPFRSAVRVTTTVQPTHDYQFQLKVPLPVPVQKGDVLLATFYVRTVEASNEQGMGRVGFVMQQSVPPNKGSVSFPATATGEWQKFYVPFTALLDYPVGTGRVNFPLGYAPQVVEIAGLELLNFGPNVAVTDLPQTTFTYAGREPGAAWRAEALQRIEQIRKADFTVQVEGPDGTPLPGATVAVEMVRHAFRFGTAISPYRLLGSDSDARKYQEAVSKLFNYAVMESALKWNPWRANRQEALDSIAWLRARNIPVRGHTLVWERWDTIPADVKALADKPEQLKARIVEHIKDQVGTLRGQLPVWDVVNEPIGNTVIRDILGEESIVEWYHLVRELDPTVKLFINENRIEGHTPSKFEPFVDLVAWMLEKGAPIDGIAIQGHYGRIPVAPEVLLRHLDKLAEFGKELEITEFDVETPDEELYADYVRDFLIATFSHPAVTSVVMWGFWDGQHHKKNAPLYRRDWSLKPSGQAWIDLVFKEWWTKEKGQTGAAGAWTGRGFLGDYEITVTHNRLTKTVQAKVEKDQPNTIRVVLGQ